jgi:hypothetical protein
MKNIDNKADYSAVIILFSMIFVASFSAVLIAGLLLRWIFG